MEEDSSPVGEPPTADLSDRKGCTSPTRIQIQKFLTISGLSDTVFPRLHPDHLINLLLETAGTNKLILFAILMVTKFKYY